MRRTRFIAGALLALSGALSTGCQQQLFPKDEPRSQFDRFDAVRDTRPPERLEDAFGNMKVNLRGRLLNTE
jgi:hypothetical protein